jgi:hypothetical protein
MPFIVFFHKSTFVFRTIVSYQPPVERTAEQRAKTKSKEQGVVKVGARLVMDCASFSLGR